MKCDSYDFLAPLLPFCKYKVCSATTENLLHPSPLDQCVFVSKARQLPLHTAEQTVI